jgi:hypothetical protein
MRHRGGNERIGNPRQSFIISAVMVLDTDVLGADTSQKRNLGIQRS